MQNSHIIDKNVIVLDVIPLIKSIGRKKRKHKLELFLYETAPNYANDENDHYFCPCYEQNIKGPDLITN